MRVVPFLPHLKALRCCRVEIIDGIATLEVESCHFTGHCPCCGEQSKRVHSWYERVLKDLPWHGLQVRIQWRSRKFFCRNASCERRIFTERLPEVAQPYARQTCRLEETLRAIAMTCGGEPGARLADRLGMSICGDGLLRILRRTTLEKYQTPQVLGVDDFAFRKGHTYGTILCDLERRKPIDLLPERSKESFRDWLLRNPGIKIISRDRGLYYSQGGVEGAPQAQHVADRWHLLSNLRDAVGRWLGRCSTEWQDLIHPKSRNERKTESKREPSCSEQLSLSRRERRQQRFHKSRELHRQGFDYRQIGRLLGIHPVTVSKFVEADHFPERAIPSRIRLTDAYLEYLKQRWEQGCHNARVLYDELGERGFQGSYDTVCRSVASWRIGPRMRQANIAADRARMVPRMSADQLAWLLIQPPQARTTEGEQLVRQLSQQSEHWSVGIGLARLFPEAMRDQHRKTPQDRHHQL